MKGFIAAVQFMTRIPVGRHGDFKPETMIPFFPLVGLLLGILLAGFDQLVLRLWSGPAAALLDVLFLVFLTGAFHLDGLGDSADGLYGHRNKEAALSIMKDSRIGVMGLVAIFACLGVKWAGIAGIQEYRAWFLLIIPALSRSSILFGIRFLKYVRNQGGTGRPFFDHPIKFYHFWGMIIPVLLALGLGWKGVLILGCHGVMVVFILLYYHRKIKGITGDMLGAMTEFTEAGLFLAASMGGLS